ncbi:TPA: type VI secretion protein, partial [Escherichia coli]
MGWSRTKSLSTELPHKPSMMLWFMTGAFMAVVGALLFIIRASEYVKALNDFSIWW